MNLGERMKVYECVSKNFLTRKTPAIIRLDGKSFHTFTKGMIKPFDFILLETMQQTMKYLCKNIQGCVLGYTQSDEITLVLIDYQNIDSSAWFEYNVQKMVSISASMATLFFNNIFSSIVSDITDKGICDTSCYLNEYGNCKQGIFDSRVFNLPKEEVVNCLIWRQQDATRNSIQAVGQSKFSHKELNRKSCNEIQDMLMLNYNINWNNFSTYQKRGSCAIKVEKSIETENGIVIRKKWIIDNEIPIFTQDKDYVNNRILI